jgi:hypothetical protein
MHIKEIGFEGVDWIQLVLVRDKCYSLANEVMGFCVP